MNRKLLEIKLEELSLKYEKTEEWAVILEIEETFLSYLKINPDDSEIHITYAIFLNEQEMDDRPRAIAYLEELLIRDPENIRALLVLANISLAYNGAFSKQLSHTLSYIKTNNDELMSMVKYIRMLDDRLSDKEKRESLIDSVNLYSKHVRNNKELGKIYIYQGKIEEGCKLLKLALRNITYLLPYVYPYIGPIFKIQSVDEYLDFSIRGIYLIDSTMKDMGEFYLKYCPKDNSQQ